VLPNQRVILTSKFAQMEFKYGSVERGRTIFENILATYPKRIDQVNSHDCVPFSLSFKMNSVKYN